MDVTKKKRVLLTLAEKISVIKKLDQGISAYKIAAEIGVGKTQIQNLRKRKQDVLNDYENNVPLNTRRRRYFTGNEEINDLTLDWFKDAVTRGIKVTGPLLQTKALEYAQEVGKVEFKASHGWLDCFIKRNNIALGSKRANRDDVNLTSLNEEKSCLADDKTGIFKPFSSEVEIHVGNPFSLSEGDLQSDIRLVDDKTGIVKPFSCESDLQSDIHCGGDLETENCQGDVCDDIVV